MAEPLHIGAATLYLADCRDVLPVPAEVIITDPPGGVGSGLWPNDEPGFMGSVAPLLRARAVAATTPADRLAWMPEEARRFDPDEFPRFRAPRTRLGKEVFWWGEPSAAPHHYPAPVAWPQEAIDHPGACPVTPLQYLVDVFSAPGETVCDPFMGSGSVGVAALLMGRRFIGVEIVPAFFDLAVRRLRRAAALMRN